MEEADSTTLDSSLNMLEKILERSQELDETIAHLLEEAIYSNSPRCEATLVMCDIALEHAHSLRLLTAVGNFTSAFSLIRLQFEALTRAVWLLYAASEVGVAKLMSTLTKDAEKAAANYLPTIGKMFDQLAKKAPPAAVHMLAEFKAVTWDATNSFVHSGIHAVQRHHHGYPEALLIDILRNSNGLSTMTGMTLANLSGETEIMTPMSKIQRDFQDCLPPLLR